MRAGDEGRAAAVEVKSWPTIQAFPWRTSKAGQAIAEFLTPFYTDQKSLSRVEEEMLVRCVPTEAETGRRPGAWREETVAPASLEACWAVRYGRSFQAFRVEWAAREYARAKGAAGRGGRHEPVVLQRRRDGLWDYPEKIGKAGRA